MIQDLQTQAQVLAVIKLTTDAKKKHSMKLNKTKEEWVKITFEHIRPDRYYCKVLVLIKTYWTESNNACNLFTHSLQPTTLVIRQTTTNLASE